MLSQASRKQETAAQRLALPGGIDLNCCSPQSKAKKRTREVAPAASFELPLPGTSSGTSQLVATRYLHIPTQFPRGYAPTQPAHAYSSPPRRHAASTHVPPSALLCQLGSGQVHESPIIPPLCCPLCPNTIQITCTRQRLPLLSYFSTSTPLLFIGPLQRTRRCCECVRSQPFPDFC